jgi:hypothetical protein
MTNPVTLTIGKRLIPLAHIALVEPFDAAAHPGMKSNKAFKARVVLLDRQSVLTEETIDEFAAAHAFRLLAEDQVATNPALRVSVESFAPAEGFEPTKPYRTRLSWRDLDGNTQSKLLLSPPETVLAIAVTGVSEKPASEPGTARLGAASGSGAGRKPTASIDRRRTRRPPAEPAPF